MSSAADRPSFAAVALSTGFWLTSLLLSLALFQSRQGSRLLLASRLLDAAERESADPEAAILLALESYRRDPTIRSLDLLRAFLDPLSQRPTIRVPLGSEEADWRLQPGGEYLTLLDLGKAHVIQIASGRVVRTFDTGHSPLQALSPDGLTAAAFSRDGTVTVWDVASARALDSWVFSRNAATAFLVSNDARVLAWIDRDATVHLIERRRPGLWDDHLLPPPSGYEGSLGNVEAYLADDGSRLALWYYSRVGMHETRCAWRLHETPSGKVRDQDSYSEADCADNGIVLSPSGRYLAELTDGRLLIHPGGAPSQGRRVGHVLFSPRESSVAIEEAAGIRVAGLGASRQITLPRTVDGESVLSISDALPNRNPLLVTQDKGRVVVRDLPSGEALHLVPFPAPVLQATLTGDRRFLVVATSTALFVQRLEAADRRAWNHAGTAIRDLRITPDGKRLLTIGDDDNFYAWDLQSGERVAKGRLSEDELIDATKLQSIQQSTDGSFILLEALNRNRELRSFGGPARRMLSLSGELPAMPDFDYHQAWLSGDGKWALAMDTGPGTWFSDLALFQLTPKGIEPRYAIQAAASSVPRFSPDAARIAVDTLNGVQVVDAHTGRATVLRPTRQDVAQFAFSPDGSTLAVVARDAGYELWDYRRSKLIRARSAGASAAPPNPWVDDAFFSAHGRYLAVVAEPLSYVFEAASGRTVVSFETKDTEACSSQAADDVYGFGLPHGAPLEVSPDERYAASCDSGGLVVVDLETGRKSAVPLNGIGAFHLAPPYLAVAAGHHVTVVDVKTMTPFAHTDHGDTVFGVFFTPDRQQLVTWGGATIRRERWRGGLAAEACEKLTRNLTPEEWRTHLGDLSYRKACPDLP